jgi:hypothetical protein
MLRLKGILLTAIRTSLFCANKKFCWKRDTVQGEKAGRIPQLLRARAEEAEVAYKNRSIKKKPECKLPCMCEHVQRNAYTYKLSEIFFSSNHRIFETLPKMPKEY